jgi:hypothetical protein
MKQNRPTRASSSSGRTKARAGWRRTQQAGPTTLTHPVGASRRSRSAAVHASGLVSCSADKSACRLEKAAFLCVVNVRASVRYRSVTVPMQLMGLQRAIPHREVRAAAQLFGRVGFCGIRLGWRINDGPILVPRNVLIVHFRFLVFVGVHWLILHRYTTWLASPAASAHIPQYARAVEPARRLPSRVIRRWTMCEAEHFVLAACVRPPLPAFVRCGR